MNQLGQREHRNQQNKEEHQGSCGVVEGTEVGTGSFVISNGGPLQRGNSWNGKPEAAVETEVAGSEVKAGGHNLLESQKILLQKYFN